MNRLLFIVVMAVLQLGILMCLAKASDKATLSIGIIVVDSSDTIKPLSIEQGSDYIRYWY